MSTSFNFDENYRSEILIPQQTETVNLYLMDYLDIIDDFPNFKNEQIKFIQDFLNKSNIWYPKIINYIYTQTNSTNQVSLLSIYVLSAPENNNSIFGLEFSSEADAEHGIGIKIESKNMNILEYGSADLAFTPY